MESRTANSSFARWKPIEIMLAVLFLAAPFYYHPNVGGLGVHVPNNITVWMIAIAIIWYSFYLIFKQQIIVVPGYVGFIITFPILITLSSFVTGIEQPLHWLFRLLFIWGGLAFFLALFQHGLKQGRLDRILFIIVGSALLQALVGVAQLFLQVDMPFWLPKASGGVLSGLFQQINNQTTYQVTAILIAIFLITRPFLLLGNSWMRLVIIISVASASFLIAMSGSRVGALTLILGLFIIIPVLWQRLRKHKRLSVLTAFAFLIGLGLGIVADNSSGNKNVIDKTVAMQSGYSGSARLGIYSVSYELIKQQPVFGHGIGSFPRVWQYAKPDFYQSYPDAVLPNKFINHPHNEIMFWLVEGGLVAGVGLVAVALGVILMLKRVGWRRGGAYAAILAPIMLHTQVELPFYTSSLHWFSILLITFILFSSVGHKTIILTNVQRTRGCFLVSSSVALLASFLLIHTAISNREFLAASQSDYWSENTFTHSFLNPLVQEHAEWVVMRALVSQGLQARDLRKLNIYREWSKETLITNPDKELFEKLIQTDLMMGKNEEACDYLRLGAALYPNENAFKVDNDCGR